MTKPQQRRYNYNNNGSNGNGNNNNSIKTMNQAIVDDDHLDVAPNTSSSTSSPNPRLGRKKKTTTKKKNKSLLLPSSVPPPSANINSDITSTKSTSRSATKSESELSDEWSGTQVTEPDVGETDDEECNRLIIPESNNNNNNNADDDDLEEEDETTANTASASAAIERDSGVKPSATTTATLSTATLSAATPSTPSATDSNNNSDNSTTTGVTNGKSVRFDNISIREYPIIIGNNPGVSGGVPFTLDWTPVQHDPVVLTIDDYEEARPGPPRSQSELKIPSSYRTEVLRRLGFSRRDIQMGTKEANIIRSRRRRTIETLHLSAAQEIVERIKRSAMNATIRRSAKSKERQMMSYFLGGSRVVDVVDDTDRDVDDSKTSVILESPAETEDTLTKIKTTNANEIKTEKIDVGVVHGDDDDNETPVVESSMTKTINVDEKKKNSNEKTTKKKKKKKKESNQNTATVVEKKKKKQKTNTANVDDEKNTKKKKSARNSRRRWTMDGADDDDNNNKIEPIKHRRYSSTPLTDVGSTLTFST
jgi:hypothetical protein